MKNSKTKYIYNRFAGFIGYKTDGKNIEIVYTEPNKDEWNTGGVHGTTII